MVKVQGPLWYAHQVPLVPSDSIWSFSFLISFKITAKFHQILYRKEHSYFGLLPSVSVGEVEQLTLADWRSMTFSFIRLRYKNKYMVNDLTSYVKTFNLTFKVYLKPSWILSHMMLESFLVWTYSLSSGSRPLSLLLPSFGWVKKNLKKENVSSVLKQQVGL